MRIKFGCVSVLLIGILLFFIGVTGGPVSAQDGYQDDGATETDNTSEEVIQFHKELLNLYMENYARIERLKTMRDAGAGSSEDAQSLRQTIRQTSNRILSDLEDKLGSMSNGNVSKSTLYSMRHSLHLYGPYIQKVVNGWKPDKKELIERRRLSASQILDNHPDLASPDLLRQAFLGELMSSASTIQGVTNWIHERRSNVQEWLRSKHRKLFPLFVRLLSRAGKVMNDEDAGDEKRQQVLRAVRDEWTSFWKETGEEGEWNQMRSNTNELLSLFRNRGSRLPGGQETMKKELRQLKQEFGDLSKLYVENPFSDPEKRLEAMIRLCKSFVRFARERANANVAQVMTNNSTQFIRDMMQQEPARYWTVDESGPEQLRSKKEQRLSQLDQHFMHLNTLNYKEKRKRFDFPYDSVTNLQKRLGTRFGKEAQTFAKRLRDVRQYIEERYILFSQGINLMDTYRQALKQVKPKSTKQMVQFERTFRNQHQSTLQRLKGIVRRSSSSRDTFDKAVEAMLDVNASEFATSSFNDQENEQSPNR